MRRIYKKLMSSVLLLVFLLNLLPTAALAVVEPTGSGTESDPYVYEVASGDDLSNAVAAINNAIATQDEATISAAAAANCDDAIAAAQAQAAAAHWARFRRP